MRKLYRRIAALLGAPTVVHPDGQKFVRLRDHWLPL